jgi:ergothioneine biosynthesis protein EgtB
MTASLAQQLPVTDAASLRERFVEIRETSMRITASLSAEDQMLQSMPDASPAKWHLAHTTWFFETFILLPNAAGYREFDPHFQYLFNSYYKQLGSHPNRGSRGLMSRPSLERIHAYRSHVNAAVLRFLNHASDDHAGDDARTLIELGLNHEQQHQELILTDIKHALWSSPLRPDPILGEPLQVPVPPLTWIEIEGGIHLIGHDGTSFAFDNESPRHEVLLRAFRIASRPVTNGEYLEFMQDGGYRRPDLWLSDGWDKVCAEAWSAPLYWQRREDDPSAWVEFSVGGLKNIEPAEPVCHLSYYEADAYARWRGCRLPTEEEWEVAATRIYARGTFLQDAPVYPRPAGLAPQMFGDVWEWTSSPYVAYPGFKPAEGLIGEYNGKFMVNQMVLRGGSCATPASHIRATYRNFFPPHARWQFSGLRLAK